MKKLISITALLFTLSLPAMALADVDAPSSYLDQAISKLPSEKAETFRDRMQQAHEENKDMYDQVHQLREDMHAIMTADNFDKDAFAAKSKQLRDLHEKIGTNLDEAFALGLSDLTTGERKKLAHAMEREHKEHEAEKKAQQ